MGGFTFARLEDFEDENFADILFIGVISGIGKGVIGEFYCASAAVA